MKKQNDSGYPVNVRNFKALIDLIISFGAAYKPVKFSIQLENLKALFDKILLALKAVDQAAREMSTAQKMRQQVFYDLEAFVTCIVGAVGSCDIMPGKVEKFESLVKKFRGNRATPPPSASEAPDAEEPAARINSTTQNSFTRKQDNFAELVTFLEGEPNYQTNELNLKLESLQAMVSELEARNDAVSMAEATYSSAIIARDKLFFEQPDGLVPRTKIVKSYVQSAFKASSREYKKVAGIPFKDQPKKDK